jgi:hypothetical protein
MQRDHRPHKGNQAEESRRGSGVGAHPGWISWLRFAEKGKP